MFVRRLLLALSICAISLALSGNALARPPYPATPPDFAHPSAPFNGDPLYSPIGGNLDRDLLVVLVNFSDATIPAGRDAAFYADQMFGNHFGTLADYFRVGSFGDLIITPAAETDASNNGAANDGIVTVTLGETLQDFKDRPSDPSRSKAMVDPTDAFVNYADYDSNNDGFVTDSELLILTIRAPGPANDACGAARGIDNNNLDGKNVQVSVALGTSSTELITHIHEIGHTALHMRDMYGFGPGSFDLTAPTCGYNDNTFFGVNSWQKMNWGWVNPTVVVEDGFYTVDQAHTSGEAFILYDPDRGTDDYFVIENRQRTTGTYDQNVQDSGLAIWRIDQTQYNSNDNNVRPMELMRPDGTAAAGPVQCNASDPPPGSCFSAGNNTDAWNPADTNTPQRTMSRTWRDGSASRVAVRAIGRSGSAVRAFFDVRGPGVLVDPTTPTGNPLQFDVTPQETNTITFPVMNTGETTDTFEFTLTGLPSGWSATTDAITLGAGMGDMASVDVVPDANAPTGIINAQVRGTSQSDSTVTSSCTIRLNVVLDETVITYTGDTSEPTGEPAGFEARVNNPDDPGNPTVPGIPITFSLSNGTDTQSVTASSDASGTATADPILTVPPGNYTLTVSSPRVGKHASDSTSVAYTVERRPTTLVYGGSTDADYSDPAAVGATLTDALNGNPLSGKAVDFTLGSQSTSAATDSAGLATGSIVLTQPSGAYTVVSSFAGDATYLPSSDSDPFTVTKETLTFVYDGDTLVGLGTTPTLSAQATEESDGSPGDLSLADARFDLQPTLTLAPFSYTTPVSGSGDATTAATALPVDLWTIDVSVPNSNGFWEGATTGAGELVLYDPAAHITGGGHGTDGNGDRIDINFNGQYEGADPGGQVKVVSSEGRFKSTDYNWIVWVGDQAIFEVEGLLGLQPTTLRLRLLDGGEPSTPDMFRTWMRNLTGATFYDSTPVSLEGGNLQTH